MKPWRKFWRKFLVGDYISVLKGWHILSPWGEGMETSQSGLPRLCLFLGLALICILCDKALIISITLSWVLWVIWLNYWTSGDWRNPWIGSQLIRSVGGLEPLSMRLVTEGGCIGRGTVCLTCEVCTNGCIECQSHCSKSIFVIHDEPWEPYLSYADEVTPGKPLCGFRIGAEEGEGECPSLQESWLQNGEHWVSHGIEAELTLFSNSVSVSWSRMIVRGFKKETERLVTSISGSIFF